MINYHGNEFRINTYTASDQSNPCITPLKDGGFVVAWHSYGQDESLWSIYAQRYAADGAPLGAEFRVTPEAFNGQEVLGSRGFDSSITALNDGGFVVAWKSSNQTDNAYGIYGQRFDAAGTKTGAIFLVNDYPTDYFGHKSLAGFNDGGFIVAWNAPNQGGGDQDVYGQRYAADGTPIGTEFRINNNTDDGYNQYRPSMIALNDGGYVVTWSSVAQQDSSYDSEIYGQRYTANNTPVGAEFHVNTTTNGRQYDSSIATLNNGGFVVVWTSDAQQGNNYGDTDIYAQRYAVDGTPLGAEFRVNDHTAGEQSYSSVTALQDGSFVVTWRFYDQKNGYDEYARRFNAEGVAVSEEFRINSYTNDYQGDATITTLNDGDFVVAWDSRLQDGSDMGVYGQRFSVDRAPSGTVSIDGTVTENQTLTANTSTLQDADGLGPFSYQWLREGAAIKGANALTYALSNADVSKAISVTVSYTDGKGSSESLTSAATKPVLNVNDVPMGKVTIDGTLTEDQKLTANVNALQDADGLGTISYQWLRDGAAIRGAIAPNYLLTSADVGKAISVTVNYTDGHGTPETLTSTVTEPVTGYSGIVATPQMLGNEFRVNSSSGDQNWPSITALKDGGFILAWQSYTTDANGYGIYKVDGQRFDEEGVAIGTEFQINTSVGYNYGQPPSITALNGGGFVVAWQMSDDNSSNMNVYGQRYTQDGSVVGEKFRVSTAATYNPQPNITALEEGGFVVVWHAAGVYGQRYAQDGSPAGTQFHLNSTTANSQPNVSAFSDGGFVVTWTSLDGSFVGVYGQRFDATGTTVGTEFQVNTTTTNEQNQSDVTALKDGGFVVTWRSFAQDGSGWGVYGQRYTADGKESGSEFHINTYTTDNQDHPSVIALNDGGFVVMWESLGQDGNGWGIFGQRYTANGMAVGLEFRVNTAALGNQDYLAAATLNDGSFVATWQADGQDAGVYAQRFTANALPPTSTVTLDGQVIQGQTLTANTSAVQDADGLGRFSYQWLRDGLVISDATQANYTLTAADIGKKISITVNYIDGHGTAESLSSAVTEPVARGQDLAVTPHPLGSEFRVNTVTAYAQDHPNITALKEGGFVVVWQSDEQDGDGYGVYAQRYTANGTAIGTEFPVNTSTMSNQVSPRTAALQDGGFVVTWQSAADEDIYGQRYAADGTAAGTEFRINTTTLGYQINPDIAVLNNGDFMVIWKTAYSEADGLYGQRYAANGTSIGNEFNLNVATTSQYWLRVAALNNGDFVVVWTVGTEDGRDVDIYGQHYATDGCAVGAEFRINTVTTNWQFEPSIAALSDGGYVVAWTSSGQDASGNGVYAQRYTADGIPTGMEFRVNTTTASDQMRPSISALNDGGFVVVWQSNGQGGSVYGQRYAVDGTVVGAEFRVDTTTGYNGENPDITILNDGGFVVTWQSGHDVYAQRFTLEGLHDDPIGAKSLPSIDCLDLSAITVETQAYNSNQAATFEPSEEPIDAVTNRINWYTEGESTAVQINDTGDASADIQVALIGVLPLFE